jgi:hypothetical protein
MANGLHTQLKRGSWTRQISLSTASGYRRASRRRGVSFTIELVIHALANSLLGLDGTAYAATMDLSNWEVAWTCSYRSDTSQLSGRGRCPGVFFFIFRRDDAGFGPTNPLARESAARGAEQVARVALTK